MIFKVYVMTTLIFRVEVQTSNVSFDRLGCYNYGWMLSPLNFASWVEGEIRKYGGNRTRAYIAHSLLWRVFTIIGVLLSTADSYIFAKLDARQGI